MPYQLVGTVAPNIRTLYDQSVSRSQTKTFI